MRTLVSLRFVAYVVAVAVALPAAETCLAQADADVQAENQRLKTEVDQLKRDLKASHDRVKLLEQQVIALQKSRTAATQPAPLEPEKVTVDESVPLASPRALRNHLTTSFETDMGTQEIGAAGDAKRRAFMRNLHRWVASMNQKLRGPVKWHVRLSQPGPIQTGKSTSLVAVDPITDVQLGDAFSITLPRASAERLVRLQDRGDLGVLVLRGVVNPDVRVAEDRETRGPIDNPPFIGPFTEFVLDVNVQSLLPVKDDEKEQGDPKEKPKP